MTLVSIYEVGSHIPVDVYEFLNGGHILYLHVIVLLDLVDHACLDTVVIFKNHSQRYTVCAKTTCAADSVQVVSKVRLHVAHVREHRDIVVDYNVYFRHVQPSCNHVCSQKHSELLLPEIIDDFVPLLPGHSSNQDLGCQTLLG